MEDKSKLFVFDKKEIALLFLFMIVISVISFTLGVRVGKRISYVNAGYTEEDKATIQLKSGQEEDVQKIFKDMQTLKEGTTKEGLDLKSKKDLKKEFEEVSVKIPDPKATQVKEEKEESEEAAPQEKIQEEKKDIIDAAVKNDKSNERVVIKDDAIKNNFVGKYTIQVGSHKTLEELQ